MVKSKYLSGLFFMWLIGSASVIAQPISSGVSLLGKWNNPNLPRLNGYQIWNDLTTYYDSIKVREYVVAGSTDSIYFLDVTDPKNIKLCDVEDGVARNVVNRDYECFSHYAYCVSDNGGKGSMQVFDLQYLPDSVHKVYDSDSMSYNTHSIFIEAKSKRMYLCVNRLKSGGIAAMDVVSLDNPEHPFWIGRLQVPTFGDGAPAFRNVHEVYVRNDTAYCSVEYQGLWIFDLRDLKKQRLITTIRSYPENGYNHSSSLDASGKNIMFTDEVPGGLSIKIFSIKDIYNPILLSQFRSNPGATAHNAHWIGSFAYVSYYHDGFYIFDINDPSAPSIAGYYHTSPWPPENYEGYKGCWGIDTKLPSGNVVASDMGEGFFVLRVDSMLTGLSKKLSKELVQTKPNPFCEKLIIEHLPLIKEPIVLTIYDVKGELVLQKNIWGPTFEAETSGLNQGMYFVELRGGSFHWVEKVIKQ
ncbi:MAG: choice-of-anchor B family protein [bacterium]|nr:choice-of-anchor B family protein [bacterium]